MRYSAIVHRDGKHTLAEFPDCGGCQTFAKGKKPIEPMARDALEGWLEAHLVVPEEAPLDDIPPRPSAEVKAPPGKPILWIEISPELALKLELLWARAKAKLSQKKGTKRVRRLEACDRDARRSRLPPVAWRARARLRSSRLASLVQLQRLPEKGEYLVTGPLKMRPRHPGPLAAEQFPEMGMSDAKAARALGLSRRDFEKLRAGKLSVTLELARSLGAVIGNGPGIWLRMQHSHDLWHLERDAKRPRQKPGRKAKAAAE